MFAGHYRVNLARKRARQTIFFVARVAAGEQRDVDGRLGLTAAGG